MGPLDRPDVWVEQILDGDVPLRLDGVEARRLAVSAGLLEYGHALALELRDVLRHGVVQPQPSLFEHHHDRDADHRLGHRGQAEDRVAPHRLSPFLVHGAGHVDVGNLALPGDEHDGTGDLARLHVAFDQLVDALQPLLGQADGLRRRDRQRCRGQGGAGRQRDDDGERGQPGRDVAHGSLPGHATTGQPSRWQAQGARRLARRTTHLPGQRRTVLHLISVGAPAGSVLLPYGGSFSNGAMVVICTAPAADAIATPPSAEAPARNSRRENSGLVVPFMLSLPGRPTYREGLRNASTAAYAIPQAPPGQKARFTLRSASFRRLTPHCGFFTEV